MIFTDHMRERKRGGVLFLPLFCFTFWREKRSDKLESQKKYIDENEERNNSSAIGVLVDGDDDGKLISM